MGAQAAVAFLHSSVARTGGGCGAREAGVRVGVGAARAHTQVGARMREAMIAFGLFFLPSFGQNVHMPGREWGGGGVGFSNMSLVCFASVACNGPHGVRCFWRLGGLWRFHFFVFVFCDMKSPPDRVHAGRTALSRMASCHYCRDIFLYRRAFSP